jgi:hypothetical protein
MLKSASQLISEILKKHLPEKQEDHKTEALRKSVLRTSTLLDLMEDGKLKQDLEQYYLSQCEQFAERIALKQRMGLLAAFHPVSQGIMLQPAPAQDPRKQADNEINNLKRISEVVAEVYQYMCMKRDERRLHCLAGIQERRFLIRQQPDNQWGVYELCKAVYELAELDRVNFNAAGLPEKLELILELIPFAENKAVCEGVMEYHDSRLQQGWEMAYLQEPAHEQADRL